MNDLNPELINTYCAIRENPLRIGALLNYFQKKHSSKFYYDVRGRQYGDKYYRAARFLYLNRTCWNGLYRENRQGKFNVPIGTKSIVLLPTDNFEETSRALLGTTIKCGDFEKVIDEAVDGDLIYADPPYTTAHNFNGFVKYNQHIFSWDDQVRLRNALIRATDRGASVIVSNADHASIRGLYDTVMRLESVSRHSVIAASALQRGRVDELVITNF